MGPVLKAATASAIVLGASAPAGLSLVFLARALGFCELDREPSESERGIGWQPLGEAERLFRLRSGVWGAMASGVVMLSVLMSC